MSGRDPASRCCRRPVLVCSASPPGWCCLPPPELWTGGSVGVDELVVGVCVAVTVGWLTVVGVWDTLVEYVGV